MIMNEIISAIYYYPLIDHKHFRQSLGFPQYYIFKVGFRSVHFQKIKNLSFHLIHINSFYNNFLIVVHSKKNYILNFSL